MRPPRSFRLAVLGWLGLAAVPLVLQAQTAAPPTLSAVVTAFLADSGVRTRGLAWTTGQDLAEWETAEPVAIPYRTQDGTTMNRVGKAQVGMADGAPMDVSVEVAGNAVGVQRVTVHFAAPELPKTLIVAEEALTASGITLTPLKCSRDTEGHSFGNLIYVVKAPGKTASALHEWWNCAQDGCTAGFTLIYRKKDLAGITCMGE